jgi:hypothetical protein
MKKDQGSWQSNPNQNSLQVHDQSALCVCHAAGSVVKHFCGQGLNALPEHVKRFEMPLPVRSAWIQGKLESKKGFCIVVLCGCLNQCLNRELS